MTWHSELVVLCERFWWALRDVDSDVLLVIRDLLSRTIKSIDTELASRDV